MRSGTTRRLTHGSCGHRPSPSVDAVVARPRLRTPSSRPPRRRPSSKTQKKIHRTWMARGRHAPARKKIGGGSQRLDFIPLCFISDEQQEDEQHHTKARCARPTPCPRCGCQRLEILGGSSGGAPRLERKPTELKGAFLDLAPLFFVTDEQQEDQQHTPGQQVAQDQRRVQVWLGSSGGVFGGARRPERKPMELEGTFLGLLDLFQISGDHHEQSSSGSEVSDNLMAGTVPESGRRGKRPATSERKCRGGSWRTRCPGGEAPPRGGHLRLAGMAARLVCWTRWSRRRSGRA